MYVNVYVCDQEKQSFKHNLVSYAKPYFWVTLFEFCWLVDISWLVDDHSSESQKIHPFWEIYLVSCWMTGGNQISEKRTPALG